MIKIVEKYSPLEFSALATNNGVVLCEKQQGAFLVIRSAEDLIRLQSILNSITATLAKPPL